MMLSIHGHVDPQPQLGQVDTGGQVAYVIEMSKHLAKLGLKVDVYTRWFEGKEKIESICPGARIIRIPCGPSHFLRKEDLYPYLDEFAENLIKFVRSENLDYDIVHSHYWDAGKLGVLLNRSTKRAVPHVWIPHSLGALKKRNMDPSTWANLRIDERIAHKQEKAARQSEKAARQSEKASRQSKADKGGSGKYSIQIDENAPSVCLLLCVVDVVVP